MFRNLDRVAERSHSKARSEYRHSRGVVVRRAGRITKEEKKSHIKPELLRKLTALEAAICYEAAFGGLGMCAACAPCRARAAGVSSM